MTLRLLAYFRTDVGTNHMFVFFSSNYLIFLTNNSRMNTYEYSRIAQSKIEEPSRSRTGYRCVILFSLFCVLLLFLFTMVFLDNTKHEEVISTTSPSAELYAKHMQDEVISTTSPSTEIPIIMTGHSDIDTELKRKCPDWSNSFRKQYLSKCKFWLNQVKLWASKM